MIFSSAFRNFLRHRLVLALAATLLLAALAGLLLRHKMIPDALGATDKKKPASAAQAVPVRTALVKRENLPTSVTGIGNVQAAMSVTVRSRIDGQLDSVSFVEGQEVRAGQLLAQLDARTWAAQVEQAEAQKMRDEALLANAEVDLKRYGELVDLQGATRQQLDTAQAQVRQMQATVRSDTAQLNAARVQLGFTSITAPITGRIGARLIDPGNIIHASDTGGLLVINQVDPIAVQFSLPESHFQAINAALSHAGAKLAVQALDRDTHEVLAQGSLVLLDNQIDASTGTVALKATFSNPQHRLWPGQSVDARLVLGTLKDALIVPPSAVQRSQSGLFTYVVDSDQTVRVQNISVGSTDGEKAQITSGLAEGTRIVTDGQYRLVPGATIVEAPEKSGDNQR
ncbi:MAG: efflux RND transporter periplasmic adaptor subunit [Pseudomonadota bacterium]